MGKSGPEFYDDHEVFSTYMARRYGRTDKGWRDRDPRQHWIVDDYFDTGLRQTLWMNGEVIKYHRTVEDYFMALRQSGFVVDAVRESRPNPDRFTDPATYERRKRIPLMLFFSALRP